MERTALDLWVGAFVVAGIAALVVLALKVGNLSTYNVSDTYQLHAYFTNVGGLKPTASVRSAGVLVGRVTEIKLDIERYEARVTMSIDTRYNFPKDTFANIQTAGLLGENYIGLLPGGEEQMLKNGEAFKQTQSAMVLEDLIGQFIYGKPGGNGSGSK
ncbi:MAG: outer membrane lipid asymmetry maintenance protein MlaD [Gallionellales bacterium 35-53-114]|jgi:phospholipid/cholesterol/gamma-HCH transport system substrate-binding protein|nr:MAG: outer membrane lipid asymmetry maintenance protein MlaD [Gallionellales bacterium 35-53-114]OYZ62232.1 MAG: outer membrane lipid asymmetry maintenance protein MlaD [Gallionellales bacterium 24-53-125]OZB10647.1 MAG: outer membrane lipid asymmetry maintenance protein MlaD [Gallionellales bacterium 39-52-133]HQS57282.1 outer membrane lipid asymmetry maintenance protein MlaD [Gallionellaceae bacterium]HQS74530.1 outer membrane lipid asymmetry maintenance protein MlaD [Gallionellaceae bacte